MKTLSRFAIALVLLAMTTSFAFAKEVTKNITFSRDVQVNGTLVKKGSYKVVFDDQTGALSIVKNGKTVAKATARLEKLAYDSQSVFATEKGSNQLISITLSDGNQASIVHTSGQPATAQ